MHAERDWKRLTGHSLSRGTHGMLLQVALNVARALEAEVTAFTDHDMAFLTDIATALDATELHKWIGEAAHWGIPSKGAAEKPSVILDARHTGRDNLTISVRHGGLTERELSDAQADEDLDLSWDELQHTGTRVAILFDIERTYPDAIDLGDDDDTDFRKAVRLRYRSDMAHLVVGLWERYKAILGERFDVIERNGPVVVAAGSPTHLDPEPAGLAVETIRGRRFRLEREAAQAVERHGAREKRYALRVLEGVIGDAEGLVLRAEASPDVPGMGTALAALLKEHGIRVHFSHARKEVGKLAKALDVAKPGWRDVERMVTPLTPVRKAG